MKIFSGERHESKYGRNTASVVKPPSHSTLIVSWGSLAFVENVSIRLWRQITKYNGDASEHVNVPTVIKQTTTVATVSFPNIATETTPLISDGIK